MSEQIYTLEDDFPQKPDKYKEPELEGKREQALGDVYDLYGLASNVHSPHTDMTRDYTLAKFNSNIINEKLPKFIREQRKIVRITKSFLLIADSILEKKFDKITAHAIKTKILKEYKEVERLLLGEVDEMVVMTRGGRGEVIGAVLMHGKGEDQRDEYDKSIDGEAIKEKLQEKKK